MPWYHTVGKKKTVLQTFSIIQRSSFQMSLKKPNTAGSGHGVRPRSIYAVAKFGNPDDQLELHCSQEYECFLR